MTEWTIVKVVLFAGLGIAVGVAYFAALRYNVVLYVERGLGWPALVLHGGRIVAAGLVFWLVAFEGAAALLATMTGFLAARFVLLHRARRTPC